MGKTLRISRPQRPQDLSLWGWCPLPQPLYFLQHPQPGGGSTPLLSLGPVRGGADGTCGQGDTSGSLSLAETGINFPCLRFPGREAKALQT